MHAVHMYTGTLWGIPLGECGYCLAQCEMATRQRLQVFNIQMWGNIFSVTRKVGDNYLTKSGLVGGGGEGGERFGSV